MRNETAFIGAAECGFISPGDDDEWPSKWEKMKILLCGRYVFVAML